MRQAEGELHTSFGFPGGTKSSRLHRRLVLGFARRASLLDEIAKSGCRFGNTSLRRRSKRHTHELRAPIAKIAP